MCTTEDEKTGAETDPKFSHSARTISLRPGRNPLCQRTEARGAQVLVVLRGRFLHGVGERGIWGDEPGELADLHPALPRDDDLLDERRRVRAERVRAEDPVFAVADEFEEAAGSAVDDRPIDFAHVDAVNANGVASLARLRLR